MLFELGRHAPGEPDDAEDADGRGDGFDDAQGGRFSRELVFERTHDRAGDPDREVQGQFGGEDLEDHDPDHLCAEVSRGSRDDLSGLGLTLNQRKLPLSCLGLFFMTPKRLRFMKKSFQWVSCGAT